MCPELEYSVFIPAYNERNHINKAIDSIFSSVCLPTKIVIVDDASRDDTFRIAIDSVKRKFKKIITEFDTKLECYDDADRVYIIEGIVRNKKIIVIIIRNSINRGKTYNMNRVVFNGLIDTPFFLVLDADSFVDKEYTLKLLKRVKELGVERVAAVYGFIYPVADNMSLTARIIVSGLEIAYRLGYVIFRNGANRLGFHYGVSGGATLYNTYVYRKFPRDIRTTGDVLTAWLMQAYGYTIYAEISASRYAYEPNNLRKLIKQRIRWALGPYQTTFLVAKKVLNVLWKHGDRRRFLAAMFTILYYLIFSTKYNLFYILLPIFILTNILNLYFLSFYLLDATLITLLAILVTTYLRRRFRYFINETIMSFIKKLLCYILVIRPIFAMSVFYAILKFIYDIITKRYQKWYYRN